MRAQDQQVRILDTPCPPEQPLQRHLLPQRVQPKYAEGARACDDPTFYVMGDHDDEEEEEQGEGEAAAEEEVMGEEGLGRV